MLTQQGVEKIHLRLQMFTSCFAHQTPTDMKQNSMVPFGVETTHRKRPISFILTLSLCFETARRQIHNRMLCVTSEL